MTLTKINLYACLILLICAPIYSTDHEKIITESTQIAEDITGLIIACKKTKDAKVITEIIKKLLCDTAQLTQSIIEKRKEKKSKRALPLDTFTEQETYCETTNTIINTIVTNMYATIEEIASQHSSQKEFMEK